MNFLFTLNASYLIPLCTLIHSLNKNSKSDNHYFVAHSNLSNDDMNKIKNTVNEKKNSVTFIKIENNQFDNLPLLKHITKEAYYRLLCTDYLPSDIDRILYLDPDIVAINNVDNFYNIPLDGYYLSGGTHVNSFMHWFNAKRLKMSSVYPYINSGVMLINIKLMREKYSGSQITDFIKSTPLKLEFGDQDVINALFYNRIKLYDSKIINLDYKTFKRKKLNLDYVRKNTIFIHYDGKDKPWHEDCKNPLKIFYEELSNEKAVCIH